MMHLITSATTDRRFPFRSSFTDQPDITLRGRMPLRGAINGNKNRLTRMLKRKIALHNPVNLTLKAETKLKNR